MRRIEKQMCAHPHVRLGHGSKDTAHVRVDTSIIEGYSIYSVDTVPVVLPSLKTSPKLTTHISITHVTVDECILDTSYSMRPQNNQKIDSTHLTLA